MLKFIMKSYWSRLLSREEWVHEVPSQNEWSLLLYLDIRRHLYELRASKTVQHPRASESPSIHLLSHERNVDFIWPTAKLVQLIP